MMEFVIGTTLIRIVQGDITEQSTEAIVNAANRSLMGGGGVDGAIHRKGGPQILEECKQIRKVSWPNGLPTGKAVITTGGNLKARYVVHTVGPVWRGGKQGEPKLLADAYRNSLRSAMPKGVKTIAFPSISTGAYGYPMAEAAKIALNTVREFLEREEKLEQVVFVPFSRTALEIYERIAKDLFVHQL
jgi:O-acetyl-ADP-ribose deacetylase (regulator of RNase III)